MRILLLTAMMILASTASAGLYKWVDNEGNVHYSQKPPKNTSYKTIKAPPPAPVSKQQPYSLEEKRGSNAEKTIKSETEKNKKLREKNCEVGKANLTSYQTYRRVRDKDGNVTVVNENERARQIETAKQLIRDFCD